MVGKKTSRDIIIKPLITEKTMVGIPEKKYAFKVDKSANKLEISKAIEEIFKVKVMKVNTLNVRGHLRRHGKHKGYTPSWKKAYVSLQKDSKSIEFFDGMA